MSREIVVIGAGLGGQIAARGIKDNYPEDHVTLVGNPVTEFPGLFYFNDKIPGVAEKEVKVSYQIVGEGSLEDYQKKSRGTFESTITESSFSKVGKTVTGYALNHRRVDLSDILNILCNVVEIRLNSREIILEDGQELKYDKLVSTVPLNVFLSLSKIEMSPSEFKYTPVNEKVVQTLDSDFSEVTKVVVYYDLTESKYYRHSHYYIGDSIYKSVSETVREDESCTSTIYPGKIIPSRLLSLYVASIECNYPEVALCGRYARWSYHYLVSDTYHDAVSHCRT